jgi:hypothetical protein
MYKSFKRIYVKMPGIMQMGRNWPGVFAAWGIYNLLNILFIWEKARGLNIKDYYRDLNSQVLRNEWGVTLRTAQQASAPAAESILRSHRDSESPLVTQKRFLAPLQKTILLCYNTAKLMYLLRRLGELLRCQRSRSKSPKR